MEKKQKFRKINGRYFIEVKCPDCGKNRLISHKNYYGMKSFRCLRCNQKQTAKKRRNPNLRYIRNGYIRFYRPKNPMSDKRGLVDEHRLIMAKIIGRPLKSHEHVHHIDGDKANNDPTNLRLMSQAEHNRLHNLPKIKHG